MPLLFPHISTPSRILTHIPTLDPSIPVPQGQILLTAHMNQKAKEEGKGLFALGTSCCCDLRGLPRMWMATLSMRCDAGADRVDAETLEPDKLS